MDAVCPVINQKKKYKNKDEQNHSIQKTTDEDFCEHIKEIFGFGHVHR